MRRDFGRREAPYLLQKVKETGVHIDKLRREKPKTVLTPENIAALAESVCEVPFFSVVRHTKFNWFRN